MNKIALCFLPLFSILILSSSCTVEKRKYQTGYHIDWKNNQTLTSKKVKPNDADVKHDSLAFNDPKKLSAENGSIDSEPALIEKDLVTASNDNVIHPLPQKDIATKYYSKAEVSEGCDNIILANGEEIAAIVTEVGTEEIRYKKCNTPDGPIYKLKRSEVFMIKYQNGTKDIITPANKETQVKKTEGFGLVSFIIGMVGGLPLGILALIFGVISLSRFKKEPGKYKGKGFAIAGAFLGLIGVFLLIYLFAFAF